MFIELPDDLAAPAPVAALRSSRASSSPADRRKIPSTLSGYSSAMFALRLSKFLLVGIGLTIGLSACAPKPRQINNVCAVFQQNDGWLTNWEREARAAEHKHGVRVAILMATVRKESGFQQNARPPRTRLLGVVPWKRQSTAYGYSQALDGTWTQYRSETGNVAARRTSFADAIDFVGWYHAKSAENLGIAKNDAYSLYLAYYSGWGGYRSGSWRGKPGIQRYARETEAMARGYAAQLQGCK